MDKIIEIQHLTKTYGKNRGVNDLSFSVNQGEIFGFLGPNGAGKSTTIRSILGLITYNQGDIKILGKDVKTEGVQIRKEIGYMPSEAQFYPDMKVKDVIKMAANMRGLNCDAEAKMLCERLEVPVNKKIEELSLGNRKKVSIVCAMQHQPKLFIFDEPTSGLDPLMQTEFFKLIQEYQKKGTTCFLSSHILGEIKKYCQNVAIIKEGKLIRTDKVENLTKTSTKHVHVWMDGEEKEYMYNGDVNELLDSLRGHKIKDIIIEEPQLEDIFMHYYE